LNGKDESNKSGEKAAVTGLPREDEPGRSPDDRASWTPGEGHIRLKPQIDRLLVLAGLLAILSLYLPWLPGMFGGVPGWKVPYATPEVPLDQIRHLENVKRPDSLFLLSLAGVTAFLFSSTSRYAGVRDLVAAVILVTGGGYLLVYFADEWGWCLTYNFVGSYAAFTSLALMVVSGLARARFMPWIPRSRMLLLLASAFLMTGWFMPWSLDYNGYSLLPVAAGLSWLGSARKYVYLMPIFPLLGVLGFASAFRELTFFPRSLRKSWPILLGVGGLIYFRALWADYLSGFHLGSWGTLIGLTLLTSAGIFRLLQGKPFVARVVLWIFLGASAAVWLPYVAGESALALTKRFFTIPQVFRF
jgi:hypothetical protein